MRIVGRLFYYAVVGLAWLTFTGILAVIAYVFYVALVGLFGPLATILLGVAYVTVLAAGTWFAGRHARGKTEEERYNDWMMRHLTKIQDRPWPWSSYGLGGGPSWERPPGRGDTVGPPGDRPGSDKGALPPTSPRGE